jgi:hypothetical protein
MERSAANMFVCLAGRKAGRHVATDHPVRSDFEQATVPTLQGAKAQAQQGSRLLKLHPTKH